MIVVGDGDIIRNKIMPVEGGIAPVPLGYDRYAGRVVYDNKEFLVNAINYLLEDDALIAVRSRTIELRKLNRSTIKEWREVIQGLNMFAPIVLITLLGALMLRYRKVKFS